MSQSKINRKSADALLVRFGKDPKVVAAFDAERVETKLKSLLSKGVPAGISKEEAAVVSALGFKVEKAAPAKGEKAKPAKKSSKSDAKSAKAEKSKSKPAKKSGAPSGRKLFLDLFASGKPVTRDSVYAFAKKNDITPITVRTYICEIKHPGGPTRNRFGILLKEIKNDEGVKVLVRAKSKK